jgi:DNA-binding MarR family transcriptional regulator
MQAEAADLRQKIVDGLERLAVVMRADARRSAAQHGINPAQDAILRLLRARPQGLRVQELARHLNVRQPTVTDSLSALERKGLIERRADPADGRAAIVKPVPEGLPLGHPARTAELTQIAAALAGLSEAEQMGLLKMLIKLIRGLQLLNAIPPQRMCVTCKYFRPNMYPGAEAPHHCAFVNAAFADAALRLDCRDHEDAGAAEAARNWQIFAAPSAPQEARL